MQSETIRSRAQRLDSQTLGLLHDEYYPIVYRYVAYRLDDRQVCEDIAGDVFLRLVEALKNERTTIQDMRAWLLGTASHLVMDHLRQKYRRPVENLEEQAEIPVEASPEGAAEQAMHHEQIRAAMLHLTADQQHVLALRFTQDCSLEETASVMGKTVGAIKVLQFRALEALRRILSERWVQ